MTDIRELDVVRLREDMPAKGLRRGEGGTVVHQYRDGMLEVEFSDDEGETYAMATVSPKQVELAWANPKVRSPVPGDG